MTTFSPYTDNPSLEPNVVFPRPEMQALSAVIFLTSSSILSFILARRSLNLNPFSGASWRRWSLPRLTCLGVYVTSWAFVYSSGILILGVGMSLSNATCSLGIFSCIFFYATSKVLIYLFLIEKVHIVSNTSKPRLQSWLYRLCLVFWTPYIVILVLMIIGRVADIDANNRSCHIGLEKFASLSLLVYDLFLNVFLTSLFVWPILNSSFKNPKIRAVAIKTMLSALAALTTSTVNILILTLMHGRQLGWVCLGSCGTDVTINAMVLFYVTTSSSSTQAISERDGVPIKEPMSGGGNLSSPSATAQSFGGQQRSTLGGGGGARPTVIVGRGGARGALMSARDAARNDYVFFPEPVEPLDPSKLGETDVSPEDGGGYVIPRDEPEKDTRRADDDFQQKPFELSRPAQPKMEPKGSARTIIGGIKRTLGLEKVPEDDVESRSIGMDSMGIHVQTEVVQEVNVTEYQPGLDEHRRPSSALDQALDNAQGSDDRAYSPSRYAPSAGQQYGFSTRTGEGETVVVPQLSRDGKAAQSMDSVESSKDGKDDEDEDDNVLILKARRM